MSEERPPSESPDTPALKKRRRRWALAWQAALTVVILAGAVVVAGFLGSPGRFAAQDDGFPEMSAAPPAQGTPPETLTPQRKARMEGRGLRDLLGGVLMRIAEEDGHYDDPLNQDAAARREFLAERFGLPFGYPRNELPEGVVPAGAEVLMVYAHPENEKARMVMVRMAGPVGDAIAAFQSAYVKDKWEAGEPEANEETGGGGVRPDRGWLIRYRRGGENRFVFLEERLSREETLAIIHDPGY